MKLSSLVVLLAASGDAKPSPEARAALKAKKNTQDLAWELLFKSGKPWGNQIRLHTLVSEKKKFTPEMVYTLVEAR